MPPCRTPSRRACIADGNSRTRRHLFESVVRSSVHAGACCEQTQWRERGTVVSKRREVSLATYRVTIGVGALDGIGEIVRQTAPAHRYAIVTDENVGPLH